MSCCRSIACQRQRTVWRQHVLDRLRHARGAFVDLQRAALSAPNGDGRAAHSTVRTGNSTPSALTSVTISACADSMSPHDAAHTERPRASLSATDGALRAGESCGPEHQTRGVDRRAHGPLGEEAQQRCFALKQGQGARESGFL